MSQDKSARQTKAGKRKTSLTKHLKPKDKTKTKDPLHRLGKNNSKYVFRRYYIIENGERHPKLIVGENKENETYDFMGFTEHKYNGHHSNIELKQNPKQGDVRPAYIRKELRKDKTSNFGGVLKDYNLSLEDEKKVDDFLNKKKEITTP